MKFKFSKKAVAVGLSAGVALGISGMALAYWTQGGTGSGTAGVGSPTGAVTVHQTSAVSGLYPGGPAVALSGNFDNTNSSGVQVGAVSAVLGTLPTGCVAADFTIAGTGTPATQEVPTGTGVGSWAGLTIKMNDTLINQDACQAQSIPITYTVAAGS